MPNSYITRSQGNDFLIAEIDTCKCFTSRGMYNEFEEAFSFPPSSNRGSIDVLLDFMRDLGWQKIKNYQVILTNLEKAKKKNPAQLNEIISILEIIKEYWDGKKKNKKMENNFIFNFE